MGIRLTPRALLSAAACLVAGLAATAVAAPQAGEFSPFGIWGNPRDSVRVEVTPCGAAVCGVVVWASDKAKADAAEAGTDPLIGTNLLRDFVRTDVNTWRGKVFVPDLRRTATGTVKLTGPDQFRARSCALGLVCKTQTWTRIE